MSFLLAHLRPQVQLLCLRSRLLLIPQYCGFMSDHVTPRASDRFLTPLLPYSCHSAIHPVCELATSGTALKVTCVVYCAFRSGQTWMPPLIFLLMKGVLQYTHKHIRTRSFSSTTVSVTYRSQSRISSCLLKVLSKAARSSFHHLPYDRGTLVSLEILLSDSLGKSLKLTTLYHMARSSGSAPVKMRLVVRVWLSRRRVGGVLDAVCAVRIVAQKSPSVKHLEVLFFLKRHPSLRLVTCCLDHCDSQPRSS